MPHREIRRIVVAVDASADSLAALEASVTLAAALGVEVVGVHVVDQRLTSLAGSSLFQEVDLLSGEVRAVGVRELERQLEYHARRAREALQRAAEGRDVQWRFHTVRGRPEAELLGLVTETDLVTVGVRGRSFGKGPGSTVLALLGRARLSVMVVRRGRVLEGAVHVLHDGSPEADRALEVARGLERANRRGLAILLADRWEAPETGEAEEGRPPEEGTAEEAAPADEAAGAEGRPGRDPEALRAELLARLEAGPARVRIRELPRTDAAGVGTVLRAERAGLLVVPRPVVEPTRLPDLLVESPCPVLVVG